MLHFQLMLKRIFHTSIAILMIPSLLTGTVTFSAMAFPTAFHENGYPDVSFQTPCDMDHCNQTMPKCPLCPSSGSANLVLHLDGGLYLPIFASSMLSISTVVLSDQGFVKSIFHPPPMI